MVSGVANLPHKNSPIPLQLAPHMVTTKSPPPPLLPPPLLLDPPGKSDDQNIHCSTANFEPLSIGIFSNPMLTTVLDIYMPPLSPGARV